MKPVVIAMLLTLFPYSILARQIFIVHDISGSFTHTHQSTTLIKERIIKNLGPGDELVVLHLGDFSTEVAYHATCPALGVDTSYADFFAYKKAMINARKIWQETEHVKQQALAWMESQQNTPSQKTDVHAMTDLTASLIQVSRHKERWLFIFSDLLHEDGKIRTNLPREQPLPFPNTHIRCLFVRWERSYDDFTELQKAWKAFFQESLSFEMRDPASSSIVQELLPSSSVPMPNQLPKFKPVLK